MICAAFPGSRSIHWNLTGKGIRHRRRGGGARREGPLVLSVVAGARNGRTQIADPLLCVRSDAIEWQQPNASAAARAQGIAGEKLCESATRSDCVFPARSGGDAEVLLKEVKRRGLEGIIGKLRDSVYEAGRRSGAWMKFKVLNEQEFVIGGLHTAAGRAAIFRRDPGRLLRKKEAAFRRKSGNRLRHEVARRAP